MQKQKFKKKGRRLLDQIKWKINVEQNKWVSPFNCRYQYRPVVLAREKVTGVNERKMLKTYSEDSLKEIMGKKILGEQE